MARRRKKRTPFQKFLIVVISLICIEICLLFYFKSQGGPKPINQAIEDALEGKNFGDETSKARTKIQLAVQTFQSQHGKLPDKLEDLVPLFLEQLPVDPITGRPFAYTIINNNYYIGDTGQNKKKSKKPGVAIDIADKEEAILAALNGNPDEAPFVYNPVGKRDPFIPFDFTPKDDKDPTKTELERYSIGQLKLKAILAGLDQPKAIVENDQGKGFMVSVGTKIGTNKGVIQKIDKDKIIIVEDIYKFTGEKESQIVEMKLRTENENPGETRRK